MKPIPISVQLYSVRDLTAKDFAGALKKIAAMGYAGVEFAGLQGLKPKELRKILDDLGLVTSSSHGAMPTPENISEIEDTARTLGYTRHVSGYGPPQFADRVKTVETAVATQKAACLLAGTGITLGIHNHFWEFDHTFDGQDPHEVFMAAAPDVFAEIDTYWVKVGGGDPARVVARYGMRAPLLHIKDGPGKKELAMTAAGKGIMDWPAVIGAAGPATEWLIIELDRCDTDMMQALADSYTYLVGKGLARGRS